MEFFVADAELSGLESLLAQPWGQEALAATVALAWHLRQRDSARTLRLVDGVMALLPPSSGRPDAHRTRCALAACEAAALRGDFDLAERWLAEARRCLAPQADPHAEGDAWLVEATLAAMRAQRERELAAHAAAVSCHERSGTPDRVALARIWHAFERARGGIGVDSVGDLQPPGDQWPHTAVAWDAFACALQAGALSSGQPDELFALYGRAAERARAIGLPRLEIIMRLDAGVAVESVGDLARAAECFDTAATRAEALGWPTLLGVANTHVGLLMRRLGALDDSRAILADAVAALSVGAPGLQLAGACSALADTLRERGLPQESLAPMARAIALLREGGFTRALAGDLVLQGRGLAAAGLPEQALAALIEAQVLVVRHELQALQAAVSDALADLHHRFTLAPPEGMTLPGAALHYAEAALAQGQRVEGWQAPARLLAFLAERWAEAGDHARAYRYVRRAMEASGREAARRLDHPLTLMRLRRRRGGAATPGAGPGVPRRASARALTPKEHRVLRLLACGFSNKEIARAIEVSDETVKWHLKNLFDKLDAGTRKDAVARARALGFIAYADPAGRMELAR